MLDTLAIARTLTDAGMDRGDQAAAVTARPCSRLPSMATR